MTDFPVSRRTFAALAGAGLAQQPAAALPAGAVEGPPPPTGRTLPVEPLTTAAWAPFGVVLSPEGRARLPINTYGDKLDLYREGFESDQPIEWFIVDGRVRPSRALFLERHQLLTQTFIPVGGKPFVMLVAPPNCAEETSGLPKLELTRAFLVPGDVGVQIHRATWHENPFPVADGTRLLVTSHAALTRGHQQGSAAERLAALPLDLERRYYAPAGVVLGFAGHG